MPTLSVLTAIDDAFARLSDRRVGAVLLALCAVQLLIAVGTQSQLTAQQAQLEGEPLLFDPDVLTDQLGLALELPLALSTLLWLVGVVAFVTVSSVAFRVLLTVAGETATPSLAAEGGVRDDHREPAPAFPTVEPWHDSLARVTVAGVGGALLGTLVVGIGLVLLVIPGLIAATVFAFTHPYIATQNAGVLEAMKRSVALTRGARLRVFLLLVVIVLSYVTIASLGGLAVVGLAAYPVVGEVLNVAVASLAWLFALALLASGFDQLETSRAREATKWEGIDDELLP